MMERPVVLVTDLNCDAEKALVHGETLESFLICRFYFIHRLLSCSTVYITNIFYSLPSYLDLVMFILKSI